MSLQVECSSNTSLDYRKKGGEGCPSPGHDESLVLNTTFSSPVASNDAGRTSNTIPDRVVTRCGGTYTATTVDITGPTLVQSLHRTRVGPRRLWFEGIDTPPPRVTYAL